ncbi:hypothetical protein CON18_30655 [Bacillus cereus]|nr:hypothetical protein CON18_30655 [Bacillus cereus]PET15022.1 hypothetical protein CN513_21165 [Bacillus cereus]PEV54222.1 hypothetical protein CN422_29120 [Bacillus cereus]PFQ51081.1 hypothetical protein COK24_19430 [Bacillus cereus]PFS79591.1 hypothetical protein COK49_13770 [Bacillus cereus]
MVFPAVCSNQTFLTLVNWLSGNWFASAFGAGIISNSIQQVHNFLVEKKLVPEGLLMLINITIFLGVLTLPQESMEGQLK